MRGERRFVVQMAGSPGAGKSVLASMIGEALGAVVLDKDVIKSAMLDSGIRESKAAPGAYEVLFALADALLRQDASVVLDSPSYYPSIPENGTELAQRHGAEYVFVECACSIDVVRDRIRDRSPMPSQGGSATTRASVRPGAGTFVVVDTEGAPEAALTTVLEALAPARH